MYKKDCVQALYLTQHILEEYWNGNHEPFIEHIHKDILWIGSMKEEYVHGEEAVLSRLRENKAEMPQVFLDEQEYEIVQNDAHTCVVAGIYRAFTKPESGIVLSEYQRVTFIWTMDKKNEEDWLSIKHLHLSNSLHIQEEDERFPSKAGKENYEYLRRLIDERNRGEVITIKDENHISRIINYSDIMYLKSEGNYIRVSLLNKAEGMRVRGSLSKFMETLPEQFLAISRSVGINRNYVKSMHRREVVMIDGMSFQIPAPDSMRVKDAITGMSQK